MKSDLEHRTDKLALFLLAGLVVLVLGGIVYGVFATKVVPDKGDVLLGGVSTGLILFLRDLVNAVRGSWAEVTQGKITDQLANSGPNNAAPPNDDPQPVIVTKTDAEAVPTKDAQS